MTDAGVALFRDRRLALVEGLENKEYVLSRVYGKCWDAPGATPRDEPELIARILEHYSFQPRAPELEEYRRLLYALGPRRKILCLDLQGLLVDHEGAIPGMKDALQSLKPRHGMVVTTLATPRTARLDLERAGLDALLTNTYSVSGYGGKSYKPVADSIGLAFPEQYLVAVSHTQTDAPSDISIPFLCLAAPRDKLAKALLDGISLVEKHNGTLGTDTITVTR